MRNKLFFFGNYEQIYAPSETTPSRNVLKAEAQQGVFRYSAADNSERTVNLLDIARANGLPSTHRPVRRRAVPGRQLGARPGQRRRARPC